MRYRFSTCTELLSILEESGLDAPTYAIQREAFISGKPESTIRMELDKRVGITRSALEKGLKDAQYSTSTLTQGAAVRYVTSTKRLVRDAYFSRTIAYALAINEVNACGGKVIAFPTAGSSGIVPGAIWAWWDSKKPDSEGNYGQGIPDLLRGAFLIASLTGVLIAQGATLAGSEGGCQAECGSAGAMAACALAYLEGLPMDLCFSAAALSLKNSLGLACDPVAGLVEVPCVKRNAFVAVNALTATELTMAGVRSLIPFDEVILAMKNIGASLPASIKESAQGGLAMTPTGLYYKQKLSSEA